MPARRPPPARPTAEPESEGGAGRQQAIAFARGLYPILQEGDATAFRRYLSRWEDVIGDTVEMAEMPADQQRRTMAAILRRPQQFNLPPWPEVLASPARPESDPGPVEAAEVEHPAPTRAPEPDVRGALPAAAETFQVDMLTGELVPVRREGSGGHTAAPDGALPAHRPRRARRRSRSGAVRLTQLALWAEGEAGG